MKIQAVNPYPVKTPINRQPTQGFTFQPGNSIAHPAEETRFSGLWPFGINLKEKGVKKKKPKKGEPGSNDQVNKRLEEWANVNRDTIYDILTKLSARQGVVGKGAEIAAAIILDIADSGLGGTSMFIPIMPDVLTAWANDFYAKTRVKPTADEDKRTSNILLLNTVADMIVGFFPGLGDAADIILMSNLLNLGIAAFSKHQKLSEAQLAKRLARLWTVIHDETHSSTKDKIKNGQNLSDDEKRALLDRIHSVGFPVTLKQLDKRLKQAQKLAKKKNGLDDGDARKIIIDLSQQAWRRPIYRFKNYSRLRKAVLQNYLRNVDRRTLGRLSTFMDLSKYDYENLRDYMRSFNFRVSTRDIEAYYLNCNVRQNVKPGHEMTTRQVNRFFKELMDYCMNL